MGLVALTRNFGKESAILAGLKEAQGDAVIVMDSDLQHPPDLIYKMVNLWFEGIDVVEACKVSRGSESLPKRFIVKFFYGIFGLLANIDLKIQSDYKLLDRKVVDTYCALPERKRFFRGLIAWTGYSSARILFDVPSHENNQSSWTWVKLLSFAIDALTGFTSIPLSLINITGLFCFITSLVIGSIALFDKLTGHAVSGFTTVILLILLIGSCIMFGLGVVGIYLGQIFNEIKRRPAYLIDSRKSVIKKK